MAIIYKKFQPNEYVMAVKKGSVVKEGLGISLLYNNMLTDALVIPTSAFDGDFAFDELVTKDYQAVCVQGSVTYMIEDYGKAAKLADYTYDRIQYERRKKIALEDLKKRIQFVIKTIVIRETSVRDVREIIKQAEEMANLIMAGLKEDEIIQGLGVRILAVNVLGISTRPETRKALEAAAREQILKEQDDAIYKRRNAAIEQERLIKENELDTEVSIAKRELEEKIKREEQKKVLVELEAENEKKRAEEQAYAAEAMLKVYDNVDIKLLEALALVKGDPGILMAKAFLEIGENADQIGNLNITPDLLQSILQARG
ncbi:MAG: hypothetical protein IKO32_02460 [Lachnospiraceae bacterium]|nr:hypothetical protein [Lachnospiraceae bacterium]